MFLQQDGRRPGLRLQLAVKPQASPSDSLTLAGRGGRLHRDTDSVGVNSPKTGKCPSLEEKDSPPKKAASLETRPWMGVNFLGGKWQEIQPGKWMRSSLQNLKKKLDKCSTEDG